MLLEKQKSRNKSTNQQINKSTNQQINKSTNQQINKSTNQQINKSTNQQINKSKTLLAIGISLHILLLFTFKYLTFFANQIGLLLNTNSAISITLPIGISFFTFQLMSYLFDVYYGKAEPQKNILHVGLYVSLFPQLIAGPIVRYSDIANEILNRHETKTDITAGMVRFIYGLAKKLLIANFAAVIADNIFLYFETRSISVMTAWLGIIAYALQIYFDFSGYSDMAIGLGRMFGFHFSENFNYPYIAKSITEFWRRWHISLSTWFRDYVYIPLGGNRVKHSLWIRNMLVVWLLTGIWHGANWTFFAWGLFYFVLLLVEKLTGFTKKLGYFAHIYTLLMVLLAWVLFRSNTITDAIRYMGTMFGIGARGFSDSIFTSYILNGKSVLIAGIILSMPVFPWLKCKLDKAKNISSELIESAILLILFVLSILAAVSATYNPFIYFNF